MSAAPVSIVIPVFDQAGFLPEAIASAQAQTVAPLEVIVVDDGSTDDPGATVARFSAVRLIRQPNRGLSAARNTGWRATRGRYLVFLDADDRLLPRALAANLERFARDPECALVYGGHQLVDEGGRPISAPTANDVGPDAYEGLLRRNAVAMHATVMYRRDRLEQAGGFDEALPACEDHDLLLRLARDHRIGFHPETIAEYRRHGGGMSENVPFMLKTALGVLDRQAPQVGRHQGWRAALAAGKRGYEEHYAREALWKLERAIDARAGRLAGASAAARVAAIAPLAIVRVAAAETRRRLLRVARPPR
jgi:glycosyltransferase involved in cell wall biosynthesis